LWSVGVAVDPPFFDDLTFLLEVGEQVFVVALISRAAIEALDEAVLHWFAWRDVVPLDTALLLPGQDGV